jgi:hypothetical protein
MTGPTELEKRLERRVRDWRRQAAAYRLAQQECEPNSEEWQLNKENADRLERCVSEIDTDLSAARVFRRSAYAPTLFAKGHLFDQARAAIAAVREWEADPAEAMRAKCDEAVASHEQPETGTIYKLADPQEQAIMRACNRLVINIRIAIAR